MPEKDETTSPILFDKQVKKVREELMKKVEEKVEKNSPPHVDMAALNGQLKRLTKLVENEKLNPQLTQNPSSRREVLSNLENRKNIVVEKYAKLHGQEKANEFSNAGMGLSEGKTNILTKTPPGNEKKTGLSKGSKNSSSWENLEEKKEKLKEQNQSLYHVERKAKANPIEFKHFTRLKGLYEGKNTIYDTISSMVPTLNHEVVIRTADQKLQPKEFDQVEKEINNFQKKFKEKP